MPYLVTPHFENLDKGATLEVDGLGILFNKEESIVSDEEANDYVVKKHAETGVKKTFLQSFAKNKNFEVKAEKGTVDSTLVTDPAVDDIEKKEGDN